MFWREAFTCLIAHNLPVLRVERRGKSIAVHWRTVPAQSQLSTASRLLGPVRHHVPAV